MKKLYCLIALIAVCNISKGQNLVPNPGFENMLQCPYDTIANWVSLTANWYPARVSPQFFHPCTTDSAALWDVPSNGFGYQQPASGDAYSGITCYGDTINAAGNFREFMGVQLTSSLVVGQQYYVSFKAARAGDGYYFVNWAINKLGALFTTAYYWTDDSRPLENFAHVYTDSVITDSVEWTVIKGSFVADSAYQYLTIGNFFDQLHTTAIKIGTPGPNLGAFYYIDDVCVSTDSLTCFSPVGINEVEKGNEVSLFPNPFSEKINITSKRNELLEFVLYDVTGRKKLNQSFTNSTSINTEQLAKGIYIYEVRNKNGIIKTGKIVND